MDSLKAHWDPEQGGGITLGGGTRQWTEGNGQGWVDLSISTAQNCLTHVITFPNLVPGRNNYQQPKQQVNILRVNTAHPWLCTTHPICFSTPCSGREEVVENSTSPPSKIHTHSLRCVFLGEEGQKATFQSKERAQGEESWSDVFCSYLIISLLINRVITAIQRERTVIKG